MEKLYGEFVRCIVKVTGNIMPLKLKFDRASKTALNKLSVLAANHN